MEEQEVKAMLHDEMVVTLKKSIENCGAWKKIATQKRRRITEDASSKNESSEGRKESDHGDEKRHQITEDVTQKALRLDLFLKNLWKITLHLDLICS